MTSHAHSSSVPAKRTSRHRAALRPIPFALIVFFGYGAVGLPLAVLPSHIHAALGYGTPVVGLAVALQSVATLLTRPFAGTICDTEGGKRSVLMGALCLIASGLLYLMSLAAPGAEASLAVLLIGRIVAGLGESLAVIGALAWCIAVVGAQQTGRAMVWIGIAMYGAIAVGAPLGLALQAAGGFIAVAIATALLPLAAAGIALALPGVKGQGGARLPFHRVIGLIWRQGLGLALGSIGFGSIAAFITLYFASRHWEGAGLTLSAFGLAYILARLIGGHLPDKIGGTKVAIASLMVETAGLLLLFLADTPALAIAGSFLTGAGFALVFPSMGVVAVKRVPQANRGAALGGYVAFFDIGLAVSGPMAGFISAAYGYPAIFAVGAAAACLAMLFATS